MKVPFVAHQGKERFAPAGVLCRPPVQEGARGLSKDPFWGFGRKKVTIIDHRQPHQNPGAEQILTFIRRKTSLVVISSLSTHALLRIHEGNAMTAVEAVGRKGVENESLDQC